MNNISHGKSVSGFTLIEFMIVVSLLGFMAALAAPFLFSWQFSVQSDSAAAELISHLRLAQTKAISGAENSDWGVYFSGNSYTIFKGESYQERDQQFDQIFFAADSLALGNNFSDQIIFSKYSGLPETAGAVAVIDQTGKQTTIFINEAGMIETL